MRTVKRKMEKLGVKGDLRNLGLKWLTRLVHTQNIETAKQLFAIGVHVFGFEHKSTEFKTALEELNSVIAPDDILQDESLVETKEEEIDNELLRNVEEEKVGERHGSPFHKLFYDIFKVINEKETANEKEKEEENPYYSKEFFKYLLEYFMFYFPMWSAVILCELQELEENQRKERAVAISSEINASHDKETQKERKRLIMSMMNY